MQISVEELAQNPARYLDIASKNDLYIARNDDHIAKFTKVRSKKAGIAFKLFGILRGFL